MSKTYNPCDECDYSFSKQNQESGMCKICEFKKLQETSFDAIEMYKIHIALDKLKEYKRLEEQGLLLRLPCKVGTHIYIVHRTWINEGIICGLAESDDIDCACFNVYIDPDTNTLVAFNEFGETWFLTEEEAEEALKKIGE